MSPRWTGVQRFEPSTITTINETTTATTTKNTAQTTVIRTKAKQYRHKEIIQTLLKEELDNVQNIEEQRRIHHDQSIETAEITLTNPPPKAEGKLKNNYTTHRRPSLPTDPFKPSPLRHEIRPSSPDDIIPYRKLKREQRTKIKQELKDVKQLYLTAPSAKAKRAFLERYQKLKKYVEKPIVIDRILSKEETKSAIIGFLDMDGINQDDRSSNKVGSETLEWQIKAESQMQQMDVYNSVSEQETGMHSQLDELSNSGR